MQVGGGQQRLKSHKDSATDSAKHVSDSATRTQNALDSAKLDSSPNITKNPTNPTKNNEKLLIIAVPAEDSFLHFAVNSILNMPPHHISRYSDRALKNIAQIFNLELLEIYHEPIQSVHFDFYRASIWAKYFLDTPLIDRGILRKIINRFGVLGRRFIRIPTAENGHTVIALYRVKNK